MQTYVILQHYFIKLHLLPYDDHCDKNSYNIILLDI